MTLCKLTVEQMEKKCYCMQAQAYEDIYAEVRMLQPSKAAFISLSGVKTAQQILTNSLDPLFKIVSTHTQYS